MQWQQLTLHLLFANQPLDLAAELSSHRARQGPSDWACPLRPGVHAYMRCHELNRRPSSFNGHAALRTHAQTPNAGLRAWVSSLLDADRPGLFIAFSDDTGRHGGDRTKAGRSPRNQEQSQIAPTRPGETKNNRLDATCTAAGRESPPPPHAATARRTIRRTARFSGRRTAQPRPLAGQCRYEALGTTPRLFVTHGGPAAGVSPIVPHRHSRREASELPTPIGDLATPDLIGKFSLPVNTPLSLSRTTGSPPRGPQNWPQSTHVAKLTRRSSSPLTSVTRPWGARLRRRAAVLLVTATWHPGDSCVSDGGEEPRLGSGYCLSEHGNVYRGRRDWPKAGWREGKGATNKCTQR